MIYMMFGEIIIKIKGWNLLLGLPPFEQMMDLYAADGMAKLHFELNCYIRSFKSMIYMAWKTQQGSLSVINIKPIKMLTKFNAQINYKSWTKQYL